MTLLARRQVHIFKQIKDILEDENHKIEYRTAVTDNCFIFYIFDSPFLFVVFEVLDLLSEKIIL